MINFMLYQLSIYQYPLMKLAHLLIITLAFLQVHAEETTETVYELSDFVVTDKDDNGYFSGSSTSATKANELIKNTPVNVTVLNEELLADLGINTTEDLAQVSASIDTDPTSYSLDQIRIRGFRNTFTRFNGFRRTIPRDGYNISRYDIVKGANSMIFGQASPGGTVNAIPLTANFRKDAGSITYKFGNKDLSKKIFNYNKIINDKLAIRLMLLDHFQGYEHAYKKYDLESRTLAIAYRPDYTSSLELHIEKVDTTFNFPTLSMKDATNIDDSVDFGSTEDRRPYDGYLSSSDSRSTQKNYNVPFNGEWLDFAPDQLLFNIAWHTRNNGDPTALSNSAFVGNIYSGIAPGVEAPEKGTGGDFLGGEELQDLIDANPSLQYSDIDASAIPAIAENVREYLRNYYSVINELNYGYQSGPDKNKRIRGQFNTLDYKKAFGNGLEFSFLANYQDQKGTNIARDSYGIGRILDSYSDPSIGWPKPTQHVYLIPTNLPQFVFPDANSNYYTDGTLTDYEAALNGIQPELFIRTYWTKNEAESDRKGFKGTLLYEKNHDWPLVGKIQNKYLIGWDLIDISKSEINYHQIADYGGDNSVVVDPMNPLNPDGSFLNPYTENLTDRASWLMSGQITDRERAFEYISLANLLNPDYADILNLNFDIENNLYTVDENGDYDSMVQTGGVRINPNTNDFSSNAALFSENEGKREQKAKWQENSRSSADIKTDSQWLATQSSLFDGRLRTLIGLRLDKIDIDSTLRKTSLFGDGSSDLYVEDIDGNRIYLTPDQINQKQSEQYTKASPSLGGLYWINNKLGIFANYAESIESPTGQTRTPLGTLPDPEIGKGYEIGMRYSTPDNSFDAQLAFYAIEKENDNEFSYSNLQLLQIYPYEEIIGTADTIGTNPELIYIYNTTGNNIRLNQSTMPGRRANGDVTLSKGIELDINYNPNRNLNFIASVNHNLDNEILEIHPKVQEWIDEEGYDRNELIDIFGRPDFRGSLTGKYSFKSGKLKGLSIGLSQHYRSGSNIGRFFTYYYENGEPINLNELAGGDNVISADERALIDRSRTQKSYIKSKSEHNTIAFVNYSNAFRSNGKKYKYSINFRVNNLFNIPQFINRSNYGTYRESRTYNITTKIHF